MTDRAPRVLVIDNDEGMVRAISSRLEYMGYECVTAGTGSQGLALFGEHGIDLVITDLNMPSGNGISLIESLRAQREVPVIVVTGFTGEFDHKLARLGRIEVIKKPFHTDQLVEMVEVELAMAGVAMPSGPAEADLDEEGTDM